MASTDNNTFHLFSSLRYDPQLLQSKENSKLAADTKEGSPFYMLRYHRDRICAAADHFGWASAVAKLADLSTFESFLIQEVKTYQTSQTQNGDALRVRVVCTRDGILSTTLSATPPVPLSSLYPPTLTLPPSTPAPWTFHIDVVPTSSTSFTRFKTTSRLMYEASRARVSIPSMATPAEVLMYNDEDTMSEGSLTSVYFARGGRWVTPPVDSGGQAGTTRRWALDEGLCVEEVVRREGVAEGEVVWVSNGVRGFIRGTVVRGAFREVDSRF